MASSLSLSPEQDDASLPPSNVDVAETDDAPRESLDEEFPEADLASVDRRSESSYEEYEEEARSRDAQQKHLAGKMARTVAGCFALDAHGGVQTFRCSLDSARKVEAAASKDMPRKGKKGAKEKAGSPTEKSKDTIGGDGASDGDVSITGIADMRERMLRDMQEEIRLERFYEMQKVKLEAEEAASRQRQLERTYSILSRHRAESARNALNNQQNENWARYMTCDGLPDPGSLSDMNTFLFLWSIKDEEASMDTVEDKCRVITDLLRKIDRIVGYSVEEAAGLSRAYVTECELIAAQLRIMLQRWIDLACYHLLRDIEANMVREDTKTSRYVCVTSKAVCCIWAPIALPVGLKRRTADRDRGSAGQRKPIEIEFEDAQLAIKMPSDMDCHRAAIRGLWLAYDHYSIEANTYKMPRLPDRLLVLWDPSLDLLDFAIREYEEEARIREEQTEERRLRLEEKKAILERMENPPTSARTDRRRRRGRKQKRQHSGQGKQSQFDNAVSSILPPTTDLLPYLPTPSEIVCQREEEARLEARKLLFIRCEKTEVNLRKFRVLGGVFRIDLFYQPPQPKDLGRETSLTTVELPKEPKFVQFYRSYEAPQPAADSERTPEVIEAEMKALESAMERLVLVTLKLPETVLWFEPPSIAHWIPERKIWSTKHVHDVKYNEEKQTIAFRSGLMGVHGLAAYKYANLPFQSWELKPEAFKSGGERDERGGVVLTVSAAIVQAEFLVRDDRVCLNSLTGATATPLQGILGEYNELESLIQQLQQVGCDLFPDRDAASYLKGLPAKHPVAEKHLRECMALLSTSYTFSWSRWNVTRDFREIVLQFKEMHGCVAKERTNITLLVTPLRTMRVRCTEVSPEFSDLPFEDEDATFYADLYQLALNTAGIKTRLLMEQTSYKLVSTVARLLERTNVICMSS